MPRGYVVNATVTGVGLGEVTVTATARSANEMLSDRNEALSLASGAENVRLAPPFTLPGGASDFVFEVKLADGAFAVLNVTEKQLKVHAEVNEKLRHQGALGKDNDMLLRLPIASFGVEKHAALLLDVALGARLNVSGPSGGDNLSETVEVCAYLAAHGILATRGAATDSFARMMFVTEGETEWEMGRTEVVPDDLTPEYRKTLRFKYTRAALLNTESIVRLEICDPMPSPDCESENFTVVGAAQLTLAELHELLSATPETVGGVRKGLKSPSAGLDVYEQAAQGVALIGMELHQKAELQGILPPLKRKQTKAEKKEAKDEKKKAKKAKKASSDTEGSDVESPAVPKAGPVATERSPAEKRELAKELEGMRHLGTVLAAFEITSDTRDCKKLVITADRLKANNLQCKRVDPYVRLYRKLSTALTADAEKELPGGYMAPKLACVLKSTEQKRTRKPVWGATPETEVLVPDQLICNQADPDPTLVLEAWDTQTASKDRMIGTLEVTKSELEAGIKLKGLKAPHFWKGRQDIPDILTMFAGCGPAGKPGKLTVKLEPGPLMPRSTHAMTSFSVDAIYERLASKKTSAEGVHFVPLKDRIGRHYAEIATGEVVPTKSFSKVFKRKWRNANVWWEGVSADAARGIKASSPFYQSHLRIGAEFGSAMQAYFVFFSSILTIQLALFLLWLPVWIPQVIFAQANPLPELISAVGAVASVASALALNVTVPTADELASGELTPTLALGDSMIFDTSDFSQFSFTPGVFYFQSYMPQVLMGYDKDTGEASYYPTGVLYLACGLACLCTSLTWVVIQLRSKFRHPATAISASATMPPGSGMVLNALFATFDHSTCYSADATSKGRRFIVTCIKEGEADAQRATEATSVVRSRSERRILCIKRFFLMSIGIFVAIVGTAIILVFVTPGDHLTWIDNNVPIPMFRSLAVTATNSLGPIIIKMLVKHEQWSSPAVTLRQTTARTFGLKMINAFSIYFGLGLDSPTLGCPEKDAAATFMQLLYMDFLVGALSFFLPKYLQFIGLPKLMYCIKKLLKGDKKPRAQTEPTTPAAEPATPAPATPAADAPAADAPAPSPPPSPPASYEEWTRAKTRKERSQLTAAAPPPSSKDVESLVGADPAPEDVKGKYDEAEEQAMYQKWMGGTKRRPGTAATSEEDLEDEGTKPKDPDYPKIGHEHPGAPAFIKSRDQIPGEVNKLVYRQMLLWIGMVISPFIFALGLISTFLLYWVQYYTIVMCHKRPKEIKEHFAAPQLTRDFYGIFFGANILAFVPFILFSVIPANPVCGPLRSMECALEFQAGNLTTCYADRLNGRTNMAALRGALLPPATSSVDIFAATMSNATTGGTAGDGGGCGPACIAQYIIQLLISTTVLLPAIVVLLVAVIFMSAPWARSAKELREARRELCAEYRDKKMMARYAAIEI